MTKLLDAATRHKDWIVSIRRRIHAEPELAFEETKTAALVAAELKTLGWSVRTGVGKTGVVADLPSPKGAPMIALRADMDALPVTEEATQPFSSKRPGAAHVCGHDAHTAMLLGTAKLLAERKAELPRGVRLLFQPSEERPPGGAPAMIADGCLDGVAEVYGLHVIPELPLGMIASRPGPLMAQSDRFEMRVVGRGGHAAMPHLTIDPVPVAAEIVLALQTLRARRANPVDPVVITVGKIAGGETFNQVPDAVTLIGTVRTLSQSAGEAFPKLITEAARHIAEAHGCTLDCQYARGYPLLVNHAEGIARAKAACATALGPDRFLPCEPLLGGEDFAFFLKEKPGAYCFLGMRRPGVPDAEVKACHSPRFHLEEDILPVGPAVFAALVLGPSA